MRIRWPRKRKKQPELRPAEVAFVPEPRSGTHDYFVQNTWVDSSKR